MSKVLAAALGAAGALAVANTASADTQVQVQSGDTVWGFAQQYATTVDSISTANQLADPNVIYVGQQLVIPSSAISAASAAATVAAPTATDNATASQAAVETTETTAASTTPAVSTTNASNVADQAQPTTVVSASDNNTAAQVSAVSQAPAQVSTASATINVAQTSAANTNNNVTTLAATTNTAAPTQTTYAATEAVATPQSNTTVQSTAAVTATPATSTATGQGNGSTANAVAVAQAQIGTPYVWGGNQPGGFDCSGLVQYAYGLGSNYRTTYQQTNLGAHHSDIQNAQSGDLYFWGPDSAPYHVAIATGNGGYIQAPTPGQNVQTGNINYYTPSFYISMN
ncbi:LysM peptidoglycan-binding domain-containing protein [Lactobacillus reuteri]|uniref:LysM peptidoglycan-binding domain-containing protein n=1 Tax=Limosilactobacillus reuteri TaxID=1598 RepID=A0A7X2G339_LIMRT|nr:C40 family peptidase [Limosilactobacillus reuteri]MCC4348742.1 NlpC/P60 family protein [Limosilactobacillus reuteri]MCC4375910.1 NlpC/P60 family protein [Limosilactobacillus reuteri]MCC4386053.1 NlpC/P60 family protein [Limosilactobacillus reuteri]MRH71571.1 LysM peptidoglycan-binding domain-containing protein [Limosilactobacillus reuteri]MRH79718.1 LysM peptidoglycan-binding domain-containing protein [Limosilactobacillus reuteri]